MVQSMLSRVFVIAVIVLRLQPFNDGQQLTADAGRGFALAEQSLHGIFCIGIDTQTTLQESTSQETTSHKGTSGHEIELSFSLSNATQLNGMLTIPDQRNNWGVLMMGGGVGNDLDWTVPGSIIHNETEVQFTVSGKSHADGPRLASALADHGFTIMRWSTIAHGDPLEDQWPMRATPRTQAELIDQANAALDCLKSQADIEERHIILLAHSQGAVRACQLIRKREPFGGFVALSPVYFTEVEQIAARLEQHGLNSCETILSKHQVPTLTIFGELDNSPMIDIHAANLLAESKRILNLTVKVHPDLGHQLGKQTGQLLDPIDSSVLDSIAQWCLGLVEDSKLDR